MTSIVLLSLAMAILAGAWLTHPLWSAHRRGVAAAWRPARLSAHGSHDTLRVPAATALLVAAAAIGFYSLHESPIGQPGVATDAAASAKRASLDVRSAVPEAPDARTAALADRLAERLKGDVDDADGWYMLGRSYASLGRHAQALGAFREAARLRPEDASLLTEWAFSAAVVRDHGGSDDPERLVERALRIDPRDPKALALAGTLALDRRDYATAVDYWEQLAKVEPADSLIGRQIQASIAQLRQRAAAQAAPLTIGGITTASAPAQAVSGVVTLAPALRERVAADDTVVVYARSPVGPRLPIAVLRKQVKDLPLRFTLDDSLAPTPAARISAAPRVIVGARIEKTGRPAAPGTELQSRPADVALGSRDLRIEIGEGIRTR